MAAAHWILLERTIMCNWVAHICCRRCCRLLSDLRRPRYPDCDGPDARALPAQMYNSATPLPAGGRQTVQTALAPCSQMATGVCCGCRMQG